MVDEVRTEKAVEFLRDTASTYGKACGRVMFCEKNMHRVKALGMIGRPGSAADREAIVYASADYLEAMEALENATAEKETLRAQRDAAEMTIEVWRSQNSAKKAGIV